MALIDLPRCVQHPARTAILATLLDRSTVWTFPGVRDRLGLTDGNLNRHLKVLVDAGWVRSRRNGRGRGSTTTLEVTADGLRGLESLQAWCGEVLRALDQAGVRDSGLGPKPLPRPSESPRSVVDDHSRSWQV